MRRARQFDDESTRARRRAIGVGSTLTSLQLDAFDERERKFDLVSSRVVVDVVCDAGFVRRVEDDQIHCILANSAPCTDAEGTASEVVDHWHGVSFGNL